MANAQQKGRGDKKGEGRKRPSVLGEQISPWHLCNPASVRERCKCLLLWKGPGVVGHDIVLAGHLLVLVYDCTSFYPLL